MANMIQIKMFKILLYVKYYLFFLIAIWFNKSYIFKEVAFSSNCFLTVALTLPSA